MDRKGRISDVLKGGDDWRGVLYSWIADCDAAVILIGRKAAESTWVKREVNYLLWRRALGSTLTIIPVLLSDWTIADVMLSDLKELEPIQFVYQKPHTLPEIEPEQFAGSLGELLPASPPLGGTDQMRRWLSN